MIIKVYDSSSWACKANVNLLFRSEPSGGGAGGVPIVYSGVAWGGCGNSERERVGVGMAELCALSLSACCKCEKRFHASLNFSPTQWSKNFSPGCHKSAKGYYATLAGFNSRITNAFKAKLSIDIHISIKDWANANDNEIFKGISFGKQSKKGATYWSVRNFCTKDC